MLYKVKKQKIQFRKFETTLRKQLKCGVYFSLSKLFDISSSIFIYFLNNYFTKPKTI